MAPLGIMYQSTSFLPPLGKCFHDLYCCFFFISKKKSPETLIEINLDLCDILESSVFLDKHYPFHFDNIEYEIGSQISYHATPLKQ